VDVYNEMPKDFKFKKSMKCGACNLLLNSRDQASQHFEGKNHLKRLRQQQLKNKPIDESDDGSSKKRKRESLAGDQCECKVCGLSFNHGDQYQSHIAGKKHQKKISDSNKSTSAESNADSTSNGNESTNGVKKAKEKVPEVSCKICDEKFNSDTQYQQHLAGKNHKKKLLGSDSDCGNLTKDCDICGDKFNSELQYQQHIAGKAHKKKLSNPQNQNSSGKSLEDCMECKICRMIFNAPGQYEQHIQGKKHKGKAIQDLPEKKLPKFMMDGKVGNKPYCSTCDKSASTPALLEEHYKSAEHIVLIDQKQEKEQIKKSIRKSVKSESIELTEKAQEQIKKENSSPPKTVML